MGRYFKVRSQTDVTRRLDKGRGQGTGADYLPWFYVHDVPSHGRSHKIPSLKFDRVHHLLSDLEASCFRALERHRRVRQIREQFPLLPYGLSCEIADDLGIRHPVYRGTNIPVVMTSDFCADIQVRDSGSETQEVAIAVKYTSDLKKKRVRELLAIECQVNKVLGRPWFLFTEETLSRVTRQNLVWLWHGARLPADLQKSSIVVEFCKEFKSVYQQQAILQMQLEQCRREFGMSSDDVRRLFKYSAWHNLLPVDLLQPIGYGKPFTLARRFENVLELSSAA